eukprot:scaffold68619_cov61-Phaeocystis_antarctica.AAC.6
MKPKRTENVAPRQLRYGRLCSSTFTPSTWSERSSPAARGAFSCAAALSRRASIMVPAGTTGLTPEARSARRRESCAVCGVWPPKMVGEKTGRSRSPSAPVARSLVGCRSVTLPHCLLVQARAGELRPEGGRRARALIREPRLPHRRARVTPKEPDPAARASERGSKLGATTSTASCRERSDEPRVERITIRGAGAKKPAPPAAAVISSRPARRRATRCWGPCVWASAWASEGAALALTAILNEAATPLLFGLRLAQVVDELHATLDRTGRERQRRQAKQLPLSLSPPSKLGRERAQQSPASWAGQKARLRAPQREWGGSLRRKASASARKQDIRDAACERPVVRVGLPAEHRVRERGVSSA